MKFMRVTSNNVHNCIGKQIIFKTRNEYIIKKVIGASESGKSLKINHEDLDDNINVDGRQIYVIV